MPRVDFRTAPITTPSAATCWPGVSSKECAKTSCRCANTSGLKLAHSIPPSPVPLLVSLFHQVRALTRSNPTETRRSVRPPHLGRHKVSNSTTRAFAASSAESRTPTTAPVDFWRIGHPLPPPAVKGFAIRTVNCLGPCADL